VCVESNPIIYKCNDCNRYVVIHGSQAYTISSSFFVKMAKKHSLKFCGQVVNFLSKKEYRSCKKLVKKESITDEDISKLHEFLGKNRDSSEIIDNL